MIEPLITKCNNTYIIHQRNSKDAVLVDPGMDFVTYANKIKASYNVVAILVTHGHYDHIDGIKYFDCPVYIHEKEVAMLYDDDLSLYSQIGHKSPFNLKKIDVKTVKDGDEIDLIGYKFKVYHTPGHTAGSVCYNYDDKILAGDTIFHESCGRTDFPTGSADDMKASLKKIMETFPGEYKIYPGHDYITTIKDERICNPYVK